MNILNYIKDFFNTTAITAGQYIIIGVLGTLLVTVIIYFTPKIFNYLVGKIRTIIEPIKKAITKMYKLYRYKLNIDEYFELRAKRDSGKKLSKIEVKVLKAFDSEVIKLVKDIKNNTDIEYIDTKLGKWNITEEPIKTNVLKNNNNN